MEERNDSFDEIKKKSMKFLMIDIAILLVYVLSVIFIRGVFSEIFSEIFQQFGSGLPILTRFAQNLHYVFILGIIILILKEGLMERNKTFKINKVIFISLLIAFIPFIIFLIVSIFLPMYQLGKMAEQL